MRMIARGTFGVLLATSLTLTSPTADADASREAAPHNRLFAQPVSGLDQQQRLQFEVGRAIFNKLWVSAPSSTQASDGLGPLYNARSCAQCHLSGGRGKAPEADQQRTVSTLLRLSVPPHTPAQHAMAAHLGVVRDPVYGTQLQEFAVPGLAAEGRVTVSYKYQWVELADDEPVQLRTPVIRIIEPGYGPLSDKLQMSLRIAPPVFGLGLLDLIPASSLQQQADPDDRDGDGISGRINWVWNAATQQLAVGRFGWKAGQPTLAQQESSALHNDIGIGNPGYPSASGDCTERQPRCLQAPNGNTEQQGGYEASAQLMRALHDYSAHLAAPSARDQDDAEIASGRRLFTHLGCNRCHTPKQVTGTLDADPTLSNRTIRPYTDLLLHDMGEGLADGRPEFQASGREWRTAPLWGLGLTQQANGAGNYLHDDRARTLLEAVLWHSGEAQASRDAVIKLSKADRHALVRFLKSL